MILLFIFLGALVLASFMYLIPPCNKLFSFIWEDPISRQQREVVKRLKELHIDGHIPEETAVVMASKEFNTSEQELMEAAQMLRPSDIRGILTGQKSLFRIVFDSMDDVIRANTGGRRKK
jgi:hypothetical protein